MGTPFLFRFREPLATLPSLLVLLTLVIAGVQKATELQRRQEPQPVQIALMELPPPPVPQPKVETPPPPKPVPLPRQQETPKPVSRPTPAKPVSAPVEPATPSTEAPMLSAAKPQPSAPATPSAAPVATPAMPAAPAPLTPPAPPPSTANIESQYVAQLRAHLNSIKRYPTGREASQLRPQGRVRVWFVLRRDGSVVEQGIDSSSNSMLLDDAARKTINRASFTGFPDGAFGGAATHRFTADLEFVPG
ncbi:TonB family protein [Herbaspirillum sp. NPDC087042]|uniref:TonB family protein n=1 Tax=Herbaspirillum sp. NPDC087042 TaxID=3364004 RepID=UPI0038122E61